MAWQWSSSNTESNETCPALTWVVMESILFQFQFIDAAKTILAQETLNRLHHVQLCLSGGKYGHMKNLCSTSPASFTVVLSS